MNVVEVSEASEPARDSAVMSVRDSVSGNETTIVVVGDGDVKAPTKTDSMDSVSENSVLGQPAPAARISTSASGASTRPASRSAKTSNAAATTSFLPKFLTDALAPVLGGNGRNLIRQNEPSHEPREAEEDNRRFNCP